MASLKYGGRGLSTVILPPTSRNTSTKSRTIISSRVRDIILDDSHDLFNAYGQWNGIGTIFIEPTQNPILSKTYSLIPAYPLFPNIKQYPLKNEIVPIIYLSDSDITSDSSAKSAYYLPPINIWNSTIHNAVPSEATLSQTSADDYEQVEAGSVRRVEDNSTEINLGKTFNEENTINIHPLLPYEGDMLYEGRFGNSIRFGSTVKNSSIPNPWSTGSANKNGDPITLIRNGQGEVSTFPWVPTLENINTDPSSLYLTSTQQIDIDLASNNIASFDSGTDSPPSLQYEKNQIILNSGRLLFNAKLDSIILRAQKHVHLSSLEGVHIDGSKRVAIASPEIYLGDRKATESLILGDLFISDFGKLLNQIKALALQLQPVVIIAPQIAPTLLSLDSACNLMLSSNYLSSIVKTR
jgi:hypothetical protein